MSEQLLNEDATISGENRSSVENETPLNSGPSEKRKRKRKKNRKASKDNVQLQDPAVETSIKNNFQEQSTELVNAADVSSKTCSKLTQSNAAVTLLPGEEKSEKQKKGQDSLKSDGTDHDSLTVTSSVNGTLVEGNVFSQPSTNTCLKPDDNESKHDVERALSEDMSMGKQKDDDMGSNANYHGPQIGVALPVPDLKAINCTSLPEVSEQISYSPNCVNTSPMNKLREHEDADNSLDETPLNSGPSEKRKRKRKKNRKASKDNVKLQDPAVETSMKNNFQEQSTELVNAADVSSKTCSKLTQSNAAITLLPGEEKSEKQKKSQDSLKSDGTDHDSLTVTSSVNGTLVERNVFSRPSTNTCLKPDDNESKHDVERALSEDMSMGKPKDDDMGSNANYHSPQIGGALPVPDLKAINCTSLPEVSEQISYSPNCVNTSPMNKLREHEDADNSLDEEHSVRTYTRKRRKVSYSRENSLETSEQGSSALVLNLLTLPNESRKNRLDHPDEALASDCLVDALEREALAGNDTSMVVGKDSLLEYPLGVSSDLEHASIESTENSKDTANGDGSVKDVVMTDLAGANYEQAERAKLNVNLVCGRHSTEEKLESRENASGGGSAQDPPIETVDQKIQPKIEDSTASTSELGSVQVNDTQPIIQALGKASGCSKKKLLVLDVNGLLVDIVPNECVRYQPDAIISTKAVFKRPFCDDFLQFCFERFNVAVWSSRTKKNVQRVLDFLFRNKGYKLMFCWDQSHCTETGYNTVENKEKPLLLKELKKLWEKQDPDLPWERGEYDESNTLLLDDSPYKALRNPPNTAIFPFTFKHWHKTDNALAAKGYLRMYLDRLAAAENVQKYVEQHPFGQRPITKTNFSWAFYLKVIGTTSTPPEAGDNSSPATKSPQGEGTNPSAVC